MPRYFFHIDDGTLIADNEGVVLPNLPAARAEAVRAAGAILSDIDGDFWLAGTAWTMHVTDEADDLLFTLQFSAKIPAGPITLAPHPNGDDRAEGSPG